MSAIENLGPHLLGRRPSPVDERDWRLASFLGTDVDLRDQALALLRKTTVGYQNKYWTTPPANSYWAQSVAILAKIGGSPPPANTAVTWTDPEEVLDQGSTPRCVGFGGAQWANTLPVDDKYRNADGDALYFECKVLDGEPGAEDGSTVRSLAKALKNRSRLNAYAFAASIDEAVAFVLQSGPVVMGTDWMNDMFNPDAQGFVKPTGSIAGGHCYVLHGYDPSTQVLAFLNSWGSSWGQGGHFFMHKADVESLFADQGEALAAIELP